MPVLQKQNYPSKIYPSNIRRFVVFFKFTLHMRASNQLQDYLDSLSSSDCSSISPSASPIDSHGRLFDSQYFTATVASFVNYIALRCNCYFRVWSLSWVFSNLFPLSQRYKQYSCSLSAVATTVEVFGSLLSSSEICC